MLFYNPSWRQIFTHPCRVPKPKRALPFMVDMKTRYDTNHAITQFDARLVHQARARKRKPQARRPAPISYFVLYNFEF